MRLQHKKWLRGIAVVFVLLVITAVLGTGTLVKWVVEREGSRVVGVPVTVTGAYLNPFSGVLHFRNLRLGNPPGYKAPYALKVADLEVRFSIGGLLSDPRRLDAIEVKGTEVYWEGSILKNNLKQISNTAEGRAEKPAPSSKKSGNRFAIGRVSVTETKVSVRQQEKETVAQVPAIEMENVGSNNFGTKMAAVAADLLAHLTRAIVTSPDFLRGVTQEFFRKIF